MAEFDPLDKNSWYFGTISREETNTALQAEKDPGVFLVRDSTSIKGDFVLCVKEEARISHYIINKIQSGGAVRFRIGDQEFSSLPELLQYYQSHFLDSTALLRPAQKQQYIAKYKFTGRDPDDLPFEKHEILTLVRKDEEQWWTMSNSRGQTGLVPAPYIERFSNDDARRLQNSVSPSNRSLPPHQSAVFPSVQPSYDCPALYNTLETPVQRQRTLPAVAKVIKNRNPSAYDSSALALRIGDEVLVTAMHLTGQWEGQLNGVTGFFPFTHVKFIDENDEQGNNGGSN